MSLSHILKVDGWVDAQMQGNSKKNRTTRHVEEDVSGLGEPLDFQVTGAPKGLAREARLPIFRCAKSSYQGMYICEPAVHVPRNTL